MGISILRFILALLSLFLLTPANTQPLGIIRSATGSSAPFSGAGDIVSGAYAWWGLRAYTKATAGTKSANVCNSGDANCADVNTLANGNFDVVTATGAPLNCGGAGGTCTIKILYDKSGNTNCTTACDATNATAANRPTLVFNCIGSRPCMDYSGTQTLVTPAAVATSAQPVTVSGVVERTGAFTAQGAYFVNNGVNFQAFFPTSASNVAMYAGTAIQTATAADSVFHTVQTLFNGASSILFVDATSNAVASPGTTGITAGTMCVGDATVGTGCLTTNALTGRVTEVGIWASGFTAPQQSAMHTNQCAYWGTTC